MKNNENNEVDWEAAGKTEWTLYASWLELWYAFKLFREMPKKSICLFMGIESRLVG